MTGPVFLSLAACPSDTVRFVTAPHSEDEHPAFWGYFLLLAPVWLLNNPSWWAMGSTGLEPVGGESGSNGEHWVWSEPGKSGGARVLRLISVLPF